MNRRDPTELLETIMTRAAALLGTPHGFIYLVEPDGESLVCRHGVGIFSDYLGFRMPITDGVSGLVVRERRGIAVDNYDTWSGRAKTLPTSVFGAVVGVPLTSGPRVIGVIGLASGVRERRFGELEIAALTRFAQLASIALDNANLFETAQRGALYDPITGLPNRELLSDRIAHALSWAREARTSQSPWSSSTSIGSRRSTRASAMRSATSSSLPSASGSRRACGRATRSPASVATSSASSSTGSAALEEAHPIAERIIEVLRAPFTLGDREWFVNASMGIAIARPGRSDPPTYSARRRSRSSRRSARPACDYTFFEPAMSAATMERVELENDLRRALERDELRLHYQPIVDLAIGPDRRARGARPLAAPDARPRPAAGVHPARRGDRADRPARPLGAGDGLPPGAGVDATPARLAARHERQPVGPAVRPAGPRRAGRARSSPRPASTPQLPRARDHRERADGPVGGRRSRACGAMRELGVQLASTTSAPATRRCPTSSTCRSTRSRSTSRSSRHRVDGRRPADRPGGHRARPRPAAWGVVAEGIETAGQLASLPVARLRPRPGLPLRPARCRRPTSSRCCRRDRPEGSAASAAARARRRRAKRLAAAAGQAKQEQEDVDEVDVQVDGAQDRGLLDRARATPRNRRTRSSGRHRPCRR